MPKVSIIIPAFNADNFIAETIESVLAQTYLSYEIIVVDDGSQDNTMDVVWPYRDMVNYIRQENGGPSRARNRGIHEATGEYVAFLDADDLWMAHKLEKQVAFMDDHPHVGFCFADSVLFDASGEEQMTFFMTKTVLPTLPFIQEKGGRILSRKVHQDLLYENFIVTASIMIRKEAFSDEDWFDECLFAAEDFDLWFRLAALSQGGYIPESLVKKRKHETNISSRNERLLMNRVKSRKKVYGLVKVRDDISQDAKRHYRAKLLSTYSDLARLYLVHGRAESAKNVCREAFQIGLQGDLVVPWLMGIAGNRLSRWFLRGYRMGRMFKI